MPTTTSPTSALAHEPGDGLHVLAGADPLQGGEARGQGRRLVGERHADADVPDVEAQEAHSGQYSRSAAALP